MGRAIAGQQFSSASVSCATKQLAIEDSSFTIFEHRGRSARRVKIAQCRNNGLAGLRKWRDGTHDPGDRFRIIGIDQDIVLDIQQGSTLQLACQSTAIVKVFMQPTGEHRQHASIPGLAGGAEGAVQPATRNPEMVDQRERLIGYDCFELIFGRAGARDVRRTRFCRDMIDPVPAQCVIVDLEFSRGSLDRCPGREKPLDPLPFEMIATLTTPCSRNPSAAPSNPPSVYFKK